MVERRRLPDVRQSITHKFEIGNHKGYLTVGLFEDGSPGELFVKMSKKGSTISGLLDTIGILTSMALQHGVPLTTMVEKLRHMRFEPMEPDKATSVIDYIFGWLQKTFLEDECPQAKHTA